MNDCKIYDIYCSLPSGVKKSLSLSYHQVLFNLLLAAFVPEDTQAPTAKKTLITVSVITALNTVSAWTGSSTSPAAACLDSKGRAVNWKQMSATASPVQAVPPVWT